MRRCEKSLPRVSLDNLTHEAGFFGGVYGRPTAEGQQAIGLLQETEGVALDPTYTGKTLAALCGFVRERGQSLAGKHVLYWHTYNSVGFDRILEGLDYRRLPKRLHWVFEQARSNTTY
jgi:1-aminocyclopropane-1-carboxylate deaminase/D-cysteine desulfhydrase-like pyridoxal-dependent ACC family enzyme